MTTPAVLDELRLVVIIDNQTDILASAMDAFPGLPPDLMLGGYHLAGATMERRIESTADDLFRRVSPRIIAPGHCTGWRAMAKLAGAGFAGYAPSSVGARYRLQEQS